MYIHYVSIHILIYVLLYKDPSICMYIYTHIFYYIWFYTYIYIHITLISTLNIYYIISYTCVCVCVCNSDCSLSTLSLISFPSSATPHPLHPTRLYFVIIGCLVIHFQGRCVSIGAWWSQLKAMTYP